VVTSVAISKKKASLTGVIILAHVIVALRFHAAITQHDETLVEPCFQKATEDTKKLNKEQQNNVMPTTISVIPVSEPLFLVCKSLYHHSSRTNNRCPMATKD
jgi:hypothetical protein